MPLTAEIVKAMIIEQYMITNQAHKRRKYWTFVHDNQKQNLAEHSINQRHMLNNHN